MANEQNLTPWKPGQSGNPAGKRTGRKNLATIIRELEEEEFDWSKVPVKDNEQLQSMIEQFGPVGSPFRLMVFRAMLDAIGGTPAEKASAREWLRKAGYGDKFDVTSDGKKIESPIIMSVIKSRDAQPQTETADSN
jgi:hypothetical protein